VNATLGEEVFRPTLENLGRRHPGPLERSSKLLREMRDYAPAAALASVGQKSPHAERRASPGEISVRTAAG
jgi:hypothetical protein